MSEAVGPRITELEEVGAEVRAVMLVKTDLEAWPLMPLALARVQRFCRKHFSDDEDGQELSKVVISHFASDTPGALVGVFLRGHRVIGHYLVSVDQWLKKTFLTILQLEFDEAIPRERILSEMRRVGVWAKARNCEGFQILAQTPKLARAFAIRYGFQYRATVMRRGFAAGVEESAIPAIPAVEN
jgi:hypothetical protein